MTPRRSVIHPCFSLLSSLIPFYTLFHAIKVPDFFEEKCCQEIILVSLTEFWGLLLDPGHALPELFGTKKKNSCW